MNLSLSKKLGIAFLSAGIGLTTTGCHNGQTDWHFLPNSELGDNPGDQDSSIYVMSGALYDLPFTDFMDAVHHSIIAYDETRDKNAKILFIDGVSINRSNGRMDFGHRNLGLFCRFNTGGALSDEVHLPSEDEKEKEDSKNKKKKEKTEIVDTPDQDSSNEGAGKKNTEKTVIRTASEVYTGQKHEVLLKLIIIADAAHYIDQLNLVYDPVAVFDSVQNSNSYCNTLLHAAGLDIPRHNRAHFDPGAHVLFLPEGFQSHYTDWQVPFEGDRRVLFLMWYLNEMLNKIDENRGLNGDTYNKKTGIDENFTLEHLSPPPSDRPKFFDPAKPFEPYKPLIIEDAQTRFLEFEIKWKAMKEKQKQAAQEAKPDLEAQSSIDELYI